MFTFENFKLKHSSVYASLCEAPDKGDKEEYQKFFNAALKKFGATSPSQLKGDKKKEFFDYVDKNWRGDHEKSNPQAEAMEIGTDKYAKHSKKMTPGEKNEDVEVIDYNNYLEEKAVSQQQQKLMGLALAVKRGDIPSPSEEVQRLADSMSEEELTKYASGKHKDLPMKKEEVDLVKIDGRKKAFREKVKQLAYEKAKAMKNEEKKDKGQSGKNKITIDPVLGENRGYEIVKKYKQIVATEQKIIDYLKEANDAVPVSGEHDAHGNTYDMPPSASSIAKAYGISPVHVQEVLDRMVRMGTITRTGDAYSYGSVETN